MRPQLVAFLIFSVAVCLVATELTLNSNDQEKQIGNPQPSFTADEVDVRFLNTLTLTLTTTTTYTTTTRTRTCTTSTAALSVCTASGRRRRGLHLNGNKEGRGLFYDEQEEHAGEEGSIFLPSPAKEEIPSVKTEIEPTREARMETAPVPFVVQPGSNAPAGQGRVLLYFGTSTITSTTTTTTTTSLTAICQSTTNYRVCGSTGK